MIRIIKDGKIPKKQKPIYTIECQYCGCVFECESSDLLFMSRGLDCTFVVRCPCCNIMIEDNTNSIETRYEEVEE